ncbi:MAG: LLM class flavin-dependent oxidoreductase [Alphaproteobacteria bacterium]|nr:LLM class flavin-dependent oxidoreductase [Alphaproteobacteria bacterium]
MDEQIEAMKEMDQIRARIRRRDRQSPEDADLAQAVQKPHPPVIVGGAFAHSAPRAVRYADGWVPNASRPQYADVTEFLPQFRQIARETGRDPAMIPVTIFSAPENLDRLKRYRDQGVARVVVALPSAPEAETSPVLDRWAAPDPALSAGGEWDHRRSITTQHRRAVPISGRYAGRPRASPRRGVNLAVHATSRDCSPGPGATPRFPTPGRARTRKRSDISAALQPRQTGGRRDSPAPRDNLGCRRCCTRR